MVTIRDVASKAGVSVATVSRLLNDSGYVGKKTKEKIEQVINDLNYVPNEAARILNTKSSKVIGLVTPDISNPYFSLIAKGAEEFCQKQGYMILLGNSDGDLNRSNSYLNHFIQHNVSGLLLVNDGLIEIPDSLPYVAIDRSQEDDKYSVITNHFLGGQLAAEEVVKTNPKNVLVMRGPQNVSNARNRYLGSMTIFEQYPNINVEYYDTETYQTFQASKVAKQIVDNINNIDTILATNDVYAFEIMHEAKKVGLNIPKDIQIIGYDGVDFTRYTSPRLTSIQQPANEIGSKASEMIISIIEGRQKEKEFKIKLDPNVLENESLRS